MEAMHCHVRLMNLLGGNEGNHTTHLQNFKISNKNCVNG